MIYFALLALFLLLVIYLFDHDQLNLIVLGLSSVFFGSDLREGLTLER